MVSYKKKEKLEFIRSVVERSDQSREERGSGVIGLDWSEQIREDQRRVD